MLALARNDNQKTVMGILSLLPGLRELPFLKAEMAWYNDRESRCLYIWQRSNWVQGVLGMNFWTMILCWYGMLRLPQKHVQLRTILSYYLIFKRKIQRLF